MIDPDAPGTRRAIAGSCVLLLHVLLLAAFSATGNLPPMLQAVLPARLIMDASPPPAPPPIPVPVLAAAPPPPLLVPDIQVAGPTQPPPTPQRARQAHSPFAPQNFGAATDEGLGLDVAGSAGGGAGARGVIAGFEAAVRRRVLAGRRQPTLAWDRRATCVVNYTVRVAPGGALAGLSIDACAVPEINAAARAAIRAAAPFPAPPDFGAAATEVHGTLVFRP